MVPFQGLVRSRVMNARTNWRLASVSSIALENNPGSRSVGYRIHLRTPCTQSLGRLDEEEVSPGLRPLQLIHLLAITDHPETTRQLTLD
ncbi:hypothetical protein TNCV_1480291 [Trichonephila clavipes]|nr:hypothetical protein TNCV_1480291 [Trichonephila clavipes]